MRRSRCLLAAFLFSLYLGLHNGYLALWETGGTQPLQVLPYCVSNYPKLDQDALRAGIPISSDEELTRLLEDYLS